jgi:hypothetical protein
MDVAAELEMTAERAWAAPCGLVGRLAQKRLARLEHLG